MDWAFLIVGSICFVEVFLRLNSIDHIRSLRGILSKATKVIFSPRISDHWKEKALLRYSLLLFTKSLVIFAVLIASVVTFPLLGIISKLLDGQFIYLSMSAWGIAASTGIAILYATIRPKKSNSTESYGIGSRILHHISLGTPFVGEALFDFEKFFYVSKLPDVINDRHVFVCGLARAGTTVLMRRLYESDQFRSLTYRDMPFVLAPNLWHKFRGPSVGNMKMQERAHGDGLMVDYDSPEALEEIFWRTQCGSDYIRKDCLVPMLAPSEVIEDFKTYVSLILIESKHKRYLSKNNNNILRLKSIKDAFPKATILIPFRDPIQQSHSLMIQHQRFTQLHSKDDFSKKYMNWLAHHEFGANHRPFRFDDDTSLTGMPNKLEYWLGTWVNTYRYIADHLPGNAILVCYETLCDNKKTWLKLSETLGIPPSQGNLSFSRSSHRVDCSLPRPLLRVATDLYNHLLKKSIGT